MAGAYHEDGADRQHVAACQGVLGVLGGVDVGKPVAKEGTQVRIVELQARGERGQPGCGLGGRVCGGLGAEECEFRRRRVGEKTARPVEPADFERGNALAQH